MSDVIPWDRCTGDPCTCPRRPRTRDVLTEIHAERNRQDRKWGEQNHPDGTGPEYSMMGRPFGQWAADVRRGVDELNARGQSKWAPILLEEVFEALAETDPAKLRAELIQVAAVAVQWIQAIDRRPNPQPSRPRPKP